MEEYLEKVAAGVEIYPLVDEAGVLFGYYEPYSEDDVNSVMPRYTANVNWTIGSNKNTKGTFAYELGTGDVINVVIGVSREGTSYLGLCDVATGKTMKFIATESTNGWNGKVTLGSGVPTATYNFIIFNDSNNTITYTVTYSL